jgi:hypothetical protein
MKIRVAKTVCAEYALESMIYLTTGMYDNYEDQDIEMEAAIVKVRAKWAKCVIIFEKKKSIFFL